MITIGISGKAGHGKDTVGEIIDILWSEKNYKGSKTSGRINARFFGEFKTVKFADGINRVISALTGLPLEFVCNRANYNYTVKWLGFTIRELKQKIGEGLKPVLGEDVWLKCSFSRVPLNDNVKITDVRMPIEFDFLEERKDTILIFVERPGHKEETLNEETSKHISETAINTLDKSKFHIHLINDGTVKELMDKLRIELNKQEAWKTADHINKDF